MTLILFFFNPWDAISHYKVFFVLVKYGSFPSWLEIIAAADVDFKKDYLNPLELPYSLKSRSLPPNKMGSLLDDFLSLCVIFVYSRPSFKGGSSIYILVTI